MNNFDSTTYESKLYFSNLIFDCLLHTFIPNAISINGWKLIIRECQVLFAQYEKIIFPLSFVLSESLLVLSYYIELFDVGLKPFKMFRGHQLFYQGFHIKFQFSQALHVWIRWNLLEEIEYLSRVASEYIFQLSFPKVVFFNLLHFHIIVWLSTRIEIFCEGRP